MKLRGYALSELLVAVAIAGLIIGVLTFLNVDYVSLGRRVATIGEPYRLGARAGGDDPCAAPGAVLVAGDNKLIAHGPDANTTILELSPADPERPGAGTQVTTAAGDAGSSTRPIRLVVSAAQSGAPAQSGGAPAQGAPPASMAAIEVGGATVGVIAPRCELPQVCTYDITNAMCQEDEAVGEPS